MAQLVLFRGKKYIKEETETEIKLTRLEREEDGIRVVLTFPKDKENAEQKIKEIKQLIYNSIVSNFYKEKFKEREKLKERGNVNN